MNDLMTSLVLQAFRKLVEAKDRNGEQRILFPQKRDGSCRYSEQEFKQMFIEVFCQSIDTKGLRYSVETPTRKKYSSKGTKFSIDPNGISGNLDLCIHQKGSDDKWQRLHAVEFKANNVDVWKDLVKLAGELNADGSSQENYLIQVLYTADKGTLNSLRLKYIGYKEELRQLQLPIEGIVVYLLYAGGVKKICEKPCYSRFNLDTGFEEELLPYQESDEVCR